MPVGLWIQANFVWFALITMILPQACWAQQAKKPTLVEGQLFRPFTERVGNWQPNSLAYQDVEFESADGTRLHGWFCQRDKPKAVVLFSHGNAGNVAVRANFVRELMSKLNVTVFIFDYRGFGKSQGVPTIEGALQDARAARGKLCELSSIKDSEIVLMGESLGGAFSVQLAAESAPRALVLQSTFSSLREAADQLSPNFAFLVGRDLLDSKTRIADYSGPLFQSHGDADRTISIRLGRKLFRAAKEPKTFFEVAGADHNDWLTEGYLSALSEFYSETLTNRLSDGPVPNKVAKPTKFVAKRAIDISAANRTLICLEMLGKTCSGVRSFKISLAIRLVSRD